MRKKQDSEEVTFEGFLTVANSMTPSVDTSLSFPVVDVEKRRYRCPVCATEAMILESEA